MAHWLILSQYSLLHTRMMVGVYPVAAVFTNVNSACGMHN